MLSLLNRDTIVALFVKGRIQNTSPQAYRCANPLGNDVSDQLR
jgi:hypothetical protein